MRSSPRRRVTPVRSSQPTIGTTYLRDDPSASRTSATVIVPRSASTSITR
jgi:hypothetical protein